MIVTDAHTHGIGGHDTRSRNPEDILQIARLHGAAGVGKIVLVVYSASIESMRADMSCIGKAMELQRCIDRQKEAIPFKNPSAVIAGVHLEGPFLNPSRCGSLDPSTFLPPSSSLFNRLIDGFNSMVKAITIAPELEDAPSLTRQAADMGIRVNMGHSDATYAEAEEGFHAGACCITHLFNAMRGFHHREPGLAGFGLLNPHIYTEVIADPHHLHRKTIELIFKTKSPDKIIIISDSVKETDINASDRPVIGPDGVLRGGSLTVTGAAERLAGMGFPEETVHNGISANPARCLGL